MANLPSLLMHPHPTRVEGPRGYLLRLASENQLRLSDLSNLSIYYDEASLVAHGLMPQEALHPELFAHMRQISSVRLN